MLFAARVPVSVGLVHWPSAAVATVVVKRSYDLATHGGAAPSRVQEPLGLERRDRSGVLLHPSDFAPTKALCDVAVVGPALLDPTGPVRIVVGDLRRLADRASALAPLPTPGPLGDPSDPSLAGDWTSARFDFERFQWAPREQRLPIPMLPLDVVVDVGSHRSAVRLGGPAPAVTLVDEAGWSTPRPVLVRLDGVGLDLASARVDLVWRGLVELPTRSRPMLVVDPSGALHGVSMSEAACWPRAEVIEPSVLRRLVARRVPRDTVPLQVADDDLEATRAQRALEDFGDDSTASTGSTTSKIRVLPADEALPFVAAAPPAASPAVVTAPGGAAAPIAIDVAPVAEDARRATIAFELPADLDGSGLGLGAAALPFTAPEVEVNEEDPLARTVARVASPARAVLPFVDGPTARPPRVSPAPVHGDAALPFPAASPSPRVIPAPGPAVPLAPSSSSLVLDRPPLAAPPPAAAPPTPTAVGAPALDPPTFARIKASLWAGDRSREEALAAHGLTELEWRLAERRFARSIGQDAESGAVRLVVERLRGELARRPA